MVDQFVEGKDISEITLPGQARGLERARRRGMAPRERAAAPTEAAPRFAPAPAEQPSINKADQLRILRDIAHREGRIDELIGKRPELRAYSQEVSRERAEGRDTLRVYRVIVDRGQGLQPDKVSSTSHDLKASVMFESDMLAQPRRFLSGAEDSYIRSYDIPI